MLRQKLHQDIVMAMKAKDTVSLEALRFFWSEIKNAEIDAKKELTDQEIISLLKKEVKRRREAIDQFTTAGREELIVAETKKLAILESYLPASMAPEAIETEVQKVINEVGREDFGTVIRETLTRIGDQADGSEVAQIVRRLLS